MYRPGEARLTVNVFREELTEKFGVVERTYLHKEHEGIWWGEFY